MWWLRLYPFKWAPLSKSSTLRYYKLLYMVTSWGANHSLVVWWSRLLPHSSGLPHQYQAHKVFHSLHMLWMCIRSCPYNVAAALIIIFGTPFLEVKITPRYLVNLPKCKPQNSVVIQAIYPFKWAPLSIFDTCKVFHSLYMFWMFLQHYRQWSCQTSSWKLPRILLPPEGHTSIVWWFRL